MSNKRYRLLKDLPDCNFGDIILYDDYAKEYYIKTKGDSRIYFQESTVENNPEWFIEEHLCKYCGSFTSQTDEQCYLYPKPKEELKEPERVGGKEKMHQWFLKWKGKKIYQYTQEQVNKMMEDAWNYAREKVILDANPAKKQYRFISFDQWQSYQKWGKELYEKSSLK